MTTDAPPIDRTPVLSAAYAVAMSARTNAGLMRHAVDDMRVRAEELLPRDDELRRAIFAFCTGYELHHRDPVHVHYLGAELERAVRLTLGLDAPLPERRDIDG